MAEQSLSQGNSGGGILALMQAAETLMKLTRGTTQTQTTTGRAQDNAAIDSLVGQIKGQVNDPNYFNSLVDSILQRSSIDFAPTRAAESASGGYNSTALQLLQNDARGRAVGESTKAITDAKTQLTQIMAQLLAQQGDMNKTTEVKTPAVGKGIIAPVAGALGAYKAYQMLMAKKPLTSMDRWMEANYPKDAFKASIAKDARYGRLYKTSRIGPDGEPMDSVTKLAPENPWERSYSGLKLYEKDMPNVSLDFSPSSGYSGFPTGATAATPPDFSYGAMPFSPPNALDQFAADAVSVRNLPSNDIFGSELTSVDSYGGNTARSFDSLFAPPSAPYTSTAVPNAQIDIPIPNATAGMDFTGGYVPSVPNFDVFSLGTPIRVSDGFSPGFSPGFSSGQMAASTPSMTGFSPSAPGDISALDSSASFNSLGSSSAGTIGTTAPYSPPVLGPTISLATAGERGEGGRSSAVGQVVGSALGSLLGPAGTMVGQTVGGMFGETVGNDVTGPVYDSLFSSEGDDVGSAIERGGRRLVKAGSNILDKATGNVSVVCTELHAQGILSTEEYKREYVRSLRAHSSATWKGYRLWGIPLARKMKTSPRLVKVMAKIAHSRMEYTKGNFSVTGLLVHRIVTPCCTLLGKLLEWNEARKNVTYTLVSGE